MTPPELRVLVVEDSPTQAAHIRSVLEEQPGMTVVAVAGDAASAVRQAAELRPDAVTMDLDIPGGGGQAAIERIMETAPVPILLLSRLIESARSPAAIQALAAGAVDVLPKPAAWSAEDAETLRRQVRIVSAVPVITRRRRNGRAPRPRAGGPVIALAASTGGPAALAAVLAGLGRVDAPVLVVQHIHPRFLDGLAEWLAERSSLDVEVAEAGAVAIPGQVHLAPGETHLRLATGGRLELDPEPPMLHRPSADVLFESVAAQAGAGATGAVLTGMGKDGAAGLLAIRRAGGATIAQDEPTSTVFGMPAEAVRLGAAQQVLPLEDIGPALAAGLRERVR